MMKLLNGREIEASIHGGRQISCNEANFDYIKKFRHLVKHCCIYIKRLMKKEIYDIQVHSGRLKVSAHVHIQGAT